ncbi:DUF397 domain-containing protein [Actinomadura hibisca]|uniref:DUF397 domain-containing protein n=1 Tax=Actinomadura hibisca TaxID=68565 RepID=UPI000A05EB12|nr:DUF397 domain-containing protein [Actinomadura hibisca]
MSDLPLPRWRKSSRSGGGNDSCVEVAGLPDLVGLRDSKDPEGPKLALPRDAFGSLLQDIRSGRITA